MEMNRYASPFQIGNVTIPNRTVFAPMAGVSDLPFRLLCHEEGDLLYDEISARLLIKEIRMRKREMLDALSIYFRVTFLHQNPADLIEDFEEDEEAADHV